MRKADKLWIIIANQRRQKDFSCWSCPLILPSVYLIFLYVNLLLLGIEALSLDYVVTFPLSLVISRKALTKYQLLFRHLLYLKYVEQLLCNIWTEHFKSFHWREESGHPSITAWKNRMYALRQRMLVFIQQFSYYVTNEVLERQWRILQSNLAKVCLKKMDLVYF